MSGYCLTPFNKKRNRIESCTTSRSQANQKKEKEKEITVVIQHCLRGFIPIIWLNKSQTFILSSHPVYKSYVILRQHLETKSLFLYYQTFTYTLLNTNPFPINCVDIFQKIAHICQTYSILFFSHKFIYEPQIKKSLTRLMINMLHQRSR